VWPFDKKHTILEEKQIL